MAIDNPFRIAVYDGQFRHLCDVTNPLSANFTPRFNAQGSGTIYLSPTDDALAALLQPDARVVVDYLRHGSEHLMSGKVREPRGPFLPRRQKGAQVAVQIQSDWRRLVNTYAWVAPGHPLSPTTITASTSPDYTAQATYPGGGSDVGADGTITGQSGYYLWPDGSAAAGFVNITTYEQAIKWIIDTNFGRLPHTPYSIATDLGRGGAFTEKPGVRFDRLSEVVQELAALSSGLGVSVRQLQGAEEYTVDVWEPQEWAKELTVESGVISDGGWARQYPNGTRPIVGGPGELAARAFYEGAIDTALEDLYADPIEMFVDATGASLEWPDELDEALQVAKYYLLRDDVATIDKTAFTAYLTSAATKARNEAAPTSGVSISLSETESFHYGGTDGIHLGDQVTVTSTEDLTFTDRITECTLSLGNDGLSVTPVVGEKKDDPDRQIARAIVGLATALRRANTSR